MTDTYYFNLGSRKDVNGRDAISVQQMDPITDNPVGQELRVTTALLDVGVQILITPDEGHIEVVC